MAQKDNIRLHWILHYTTDSAKSYRDNIVSIWVNADKKKELSAQLTLATFAQNIAFSSLIYLVYLVY